MGTFLYAPGVRVFIDTLRAGVIEVTDDLARGTLTLVENQPSRFNCSIINPRRKYDGLFTPNDRISVRMKRVRWMQVFSGYLSGVPVLSTYPRTVPLSAMDSLKRLKYRPWDPGAVESWNLLHSVGQGQDGMNDTDGGIGKKIQILLTDVAGWPGNQIHLGRLPEHWFENVSDLFRTVSASIQVDQATLGIQPVIAGQSAVDNGTVSIPGLPTDATPPGGAAHTGVVPASSGKVSWFGGPHGGAYGTMALSGESGTNPNDPWYCAMRFPYRATGADGMPTGPTDNAAFNWWKKQKLLVVNPRNNKGVVVRCADWGPLGTLDRVIDLSQQALEQVLGATTDSTVLIRFAAPDAFLGPANPAQAAAAGTPLAPGAVAKTPLADNWTVRIRDRLPVNLTWGYGNGEVPLDQLRAVPGTIHLLFPPASVSMETMIAEAKKDGVSVTISNAYRDLQHQKAAKADATAKGRPSFAAEPGFSNHGLGFACDLNINGESDPAYIWLKAHASDYGWVHPPYMEPGGSGPHEPWHWEFWAAPNFIESGQYNPLGTPAATDATGAMNGGAPANLINAFNWYGAPDPASSVLAGPRALMNDEAVLNTLSMLVNTSMRSFMAAPNGDFIAWFPDYFGVYGTAGKMVIQSIEIMGDGFTLMWDDESLVTHQFTAGAPTGYSSGGAPGEAVSIYQQYMSLGIATVEFPEVMKALFNIDPKDPRASAFLDSNTILQRFGARPNFQPMGTITGPEAEFWYACWLFQRNWATQFSSQVPLTFMPEVFPGMLLQLPEYGFQTYVETVTHSFDFGMNGGFTTTAGIVAPSATDGSGLIALPRAA